MVVQASTQLGPSYLGLESGLQVLCRYQQEPLIDQVQDKRQDRRSIRQRRAQIRVVEDDVDR